MTRRHAVDAAKVAILTHLGRPSVGRMKGHLAMACFYRDGRIMQNGSKEPNDWVLTTAMRELKDEGRIVAERQQWRLVSGGTP